MGGKNLLAVDVSIGGVSLTQKAVFAKNMSVMLQSGLTITDALGIIHDSSHGKLKKVVGKVLGSVEGGQSLADSFAQHPKVFSGLFIGATRAGEKSGTLVQNLEQVASQLEKDKELVSKVRGAMLYPTVVLAAAFFLGIGMAYFVLPQITPLFEGLRIDLPFTTKALIWVSRLVQDSGKVLFPALIFGAAGMVWIVRRRFMRPFTHWLVLHLPIIRHVVRNANLARFCRGLGTTLRSGLTIDEALTVVREALENYYFKRALAQVQSSVGRGAKLSENLEQFDMLFPLMMTRMIQVGEQSGKLEETLEYLADFYEVEVDSATKSLSTAIEPILLVVVGAVVGFLALSIITPIYDITGGIKR